MYLFQILQKKPVLFLLVPPVSAQIFCKYSRFFFGNFPSSVVCQPLPCDIFVLHNITSTGAHYPAKYH